MRFMLRDYQTSKCSLSLPTAGQDHIFSAISQNSYKLRQLTQLSAIFPVKVLLVFKNKVIVKCWKIFFHYEIHSHIQ